MGFFIHAALLTARCETGHISLHLANPIILRFLEFLMYLKHRFDY